VVTGIPEKIFTPAQDTNLFELCYHLLAFDYSFVLILHFCLFL